MSGGGFSFLFSLHHPLSLLYLLMNYKTKFHRNGEVTFWNVYEQNWNRVRAKSISDQNLASMNKKDRERILKMI